MAPSTEMGPMVDEPTLAKVEQHVESALQAGSFGCRLYRKRPANHTGDPETGCRQHSDQLSSGIGPGRRGRVFQ